MKYNFLVVSDTNQVTDYIYSTTKYRFIRGATMLLDYLNTDYTLKLVSDNHGQLLSTGGGETRVLFEKEEDANSYMMQLKQLYLDETDHVTISIVSIQRLQDEKISKWITRADQELRLEEIANSKKVIHQMRVYPIMKRCECCNVRAAEHYEPIVIELEKQRLDDHKYICQSCQLKLNFLRTVIKQIKGNASLVNKPKYENGIYKVHSSLSHISKVVDTWVNSIDGLFEEGSTENKVGFLYADGKDIGKLFKDNLEESENDEEFIKKYKFYSDKLNDSLVQAAIHAQKTVTLSLRKNTDELILVDYSLIGGDDIAAVMPGKIILPYAYYLIKYFREETRKNFNKECDLSVGVVIAKKSYPISELFQLAYDLMARTKYNNSLGTMDFQIIYDSVIQSIDEKRNGSVIAQSRHLYLEGYKIDEQDTESFYQLYSLASQLKNSDFPTSKIKEIYHITLEENEVLMKYYWKNWFSRLKKEHRAIFENWNANLKDTPFCFEKGGMQYTPIRDLFDLMGLLEKDDLIDLKAVKIANEK